MRKIIYTRPDNSMSIVIPAKDTHPPENISDAEAEQRAWEKLPTFAINPRWADDSEIPPDRTFRDAWHDAGKVEIHMGKAREIHKEKMRYARVPKLAALDVEFMRALEKNDMAAAAAAATKKQALRDVTADPEIEAAQTPEALIAVWPDILK